MELNDVMRTTFSAREYTGELLSDEALFNILDNARFAPSGGNRQGARIIVVRAPKTRALLSELARPAARTAPRFNPLAGGAVFVDARVAVAVRNPDVSVYRYVRMRWQVERPGRLLHGAALHSFDAGGRSHYKSLP